MELKRIIEKISVEEEILNNLLLEVDKTLDTETIISWFIRILKSYPNICEKFALPSDTRLKNALLKILTIESSIKNPISYLLTNRLEQYLASLPNICSHNMSSQSIKDSMEIYYKLKRLINFYKTASQNKSISATTTALKTHRLHLYKESNNETDLRVVLRSFYEDKNDGNRNDRNLLLNFILEQLVNESNQPGHISERRHLWWSIFTLLSESDLKWITTNKNAIDNQINYLLSLPEYSPSGDVLSKSSVPELITVENDKLWETINICRILITEFSFNLELITIEKLKTRLNQNVDFIFSNDLYSSIVSTKNKLILLYELANYQSIESSLSTVNDDKYSYKSNFIGEFLYNMDTLESSRLILKKISKFIDTPDRWTKHTLTSLMICGAPGQGKSEFANQFSLELKKIANNTGKEIVINFSSVGKEINSNEDLNRILDNSTNYSNPELIVVNIFDEIDKAIFNFYTPFLSKLEMKVISGQTPLTIWIFAQSSFPRFDSYINYSNKLENKSLRDFLTRLQLGYIELPELKFSPEQRLLSAIGVAKKSFKKSSSISKGWAFYFMSSLTIEHNRLLIKEVNEKTEIIDQVLVLNNMKLIETIEQIINSKANEKWIDMN